MQGVEEKVKLKFLGLKSYDKRAQRATAFARSVDIDLIEPIRETTIEAKGQTRKKEQFLGRKRCYMASLYDKLREWGITTGGNGCEIGR